MIFFAKQIRIYKTPKYQNYCRHFMYYLQNSRATYSIVSTSNVDNGQGLG